jgi:hypothetical protein
MDQPRNFVEALESRRLLTGYVFGWGPEAGLVLDVDGTDAADHIEVKLSDDGAKVQVVVNGNVADEANVDEVKLVAVAAAAGDDTVTIDEAVKARVNVRGGAGNDTLTADNESAHLSGDDGNRQRRRAELHQRRRR